MRWRWSVIVAGALLALAWSAVPASAQRGTARRSAAPRPAAVPRGAQAERAWPTDADGEEALDPLEARRAAIERWHEERRAWLEARREGWPLAPGGWSGEVGPRPAERAGGGVGGATTGRSAPAGARAAAGARNAPGAWDVADGWAEADGWGAAAALGGPAWGVDGFDGGFVGRSAFCLPIGFEGFFDRRRDRRDRCGRFDGFDRFDRFGRFDRFDRFGRFAPFGGFRGRGALPPGYLPFPSLDPYAYPYPNPAVYPVPHRFERRFHPDEAPSREPPDYPADPYAAFGAYGYGYGIPPYGGYWGGGPGGFPWSGGFPWPSGPGGPGGPWGRDPGPGDVDRVDCALLAGVTERGSSFRVVVRPSREGVRSGAELLDGISRRLAAGTPVVVRGVDGLEVRLSGAARARLRLERCGG